MHIIDYSDRIEGLIVIEDAVNEEEENELIKWANDGIWCGLGVEPNPELKRRTQQYGHLFSYRYRKVMEEYGPLPERIDFFIDRIMKYGWMPHKPNHLLINEYEVGQGIMPHIDAPALFGTVILSLSLLSDCIMKFSNEVGSVDIILPRRSLVILSKDARYKYKHSISKELIDVSDTGVSIIRDKRISFTFREIIAWEVVKEEM